MPLSARTEQVIALSGNELSQAEVARIVGFSRQRVEQLVRRYGLSFRDGRRGKPPILCSRCRKETESKKSPPLCSACRHEGAWIEIPCLTCGKPIRTRRSEVNRRRSIPLYHRPFRQEHRTCQSNRTAPCMVCGNSFLLTANQAWGVRRGHRVRCRNNNCRSKWYHQHMSMMRAAQRDGKEV